MVVICVGQKDSRLGLIQPILTAILCAEEETCQGKMKEFPVLLFSKHLELLSWPLMYKKYSKLQSNLFERIFSHGEIP